MSKISVREKLEQMERERNKSHVNELTEIYEKYDKADTIAFNTEDEALKEAKYKERDAVAYEMINYVQENLIDKPLRPDALLICQDATDKLEHDGDVYASWEHLNKIALTENDKIFLVETSYSDSDGPEATIYEINADKLTEEFFKFNEPNIDSLIKLTKFIEENNLSPELTASRNSIPNDSNNGSHGGGYER